MLEVEAIHTYYGLSHILHSLSLTVEKGEIVCLLGRNGAGKSTTMRSIMGLTPPRRGKILFKGESIAGMKPFRIARKGIGFVPDSREVFADLSIDENLEISERQFDGRNLWDRGKVYELFPALKRISSRKAGCLSGGERQMLTIARALVTNPDFLLLDEPTEGLAPLVVAMLEEKIGEFKSLGLTVLLAEQNQKVALGLSDRAYIIDNGAIRWHGAVEQLRENEEVCRKYLLV
ncbi:MAG: ABC transporter ATP-binding protein [Deltaproteobacteria bacterium]|jgi:branched-chain amino acid transport system ATP-binding protein|nr:ABC transporter ATP-binding protein [Deltaproteobacteria bacterium]